jgi:Phosphatidylinositol N-acetylglucosaminyltransferase
VLNADVRPRSFWQVVEDAQAVSLQVSVVVASAEIYLLLRSGRASTVAILWTVVALTTLGQVLIRQASGPCSLDH